MSYHQMSEENINFSDQVKGHTKQLGADIVGIASTERFEGTPEGYRPTDLLEGAQSVVVFGIRNLLAVVNSSPSYVYSKIGYYFLNRYLDNIAYELGRFLDNRGFVTLPLGAPQAEYIIENDEPGGTIDRFRGIFSLRHAAERAGLGRIGKSSLLITPQYGPRVRLGALITDALLMPDPLLEDTICLPKCRLCVEACPAKAITDQGHLNHIRCFMEEKKRYDFNKKRLKDMRKAMKGDIVAYEAKFVSAANYVGRSCGLYCLKVCPVGKRNTT